MNREDFPMLKHVYVYLDNSATTFKPYQVIDEITDYYTNYSANAHRGDYSISYKVDVAFENARTNIASFINSKPEEVIFCSGTTEAMNIIVSGFFEKKLKPGSEIIISQSEHASNALPWFRLAKENNLKIVYAPLENDLHITLKGLKSVVTKNTKVIALSEITNVIGDLRPIKQICEFAHQNGIYVVVDGAQSVPHKPTDVKDSDVDFLVVSGHKMCGPTGIGILYGKKELLEQVEPLSLGGGMSESFDNENEVYLKDLPYRLEAGTPNIAGVLGLGAAANYLTKIGMDNIFKYEQELKSYFISKITNIPHINIINKNTDSGIISFNVEGIFAQDVAFYLNKYNVCVRAGNHCAKMLKNVIGVKNTIRVSLYFYNTHKEIDLLVKLLSDKQKILKEMI